MNEKPNESEENKSLIVQTEAANATSEFAPGDTFASVFAQNFKAQLQNSGVPKETEILVWERISRFFEPWPDWVFRIAAQVFHVQYPTFSKAKIYDVLRSIHYFVFFTTLEDFDDFESFPEPEIISEVLGAFTGHAMAHLERETNASETLSADKSEGVEALKKSMDSMGNTAAKLFKKWPETFLIFQQSLIEAEDKTFDRRRGVPKETPLTPIYRKILYNWRIIESLSGPRALTEFLSQDLGNQHIEDKYERVKAICKRMQITFKPIVKGQ